MASKVPVKCKGCGEVRMLRPYDAKRAKQCKSCHNRSIARKGWEATSAKYGPKVAVKHLRDYRLANPSSLERRVMDVLDAAGIEYEREVWVERDGTVFLVDFVIGGEIAVEVNGEWAHQFHAERDARKVRVLKAEGYKVVSLAERSLESGLAALLN